MCEKHDDFSERSVARIPAFEVPDFWAVKASNLE